MNADDFGALIADTAMRFDGACACGPFRQRIFDAVGMPFDPTPFHVVNGKVHGISTCYVFAHHVWTLAGADIPAWHPGDFVSTLRTQLPKTWQPWQDGCEPSIGDMLVLGNRSKGGTHVAIVTSLDGETVEGGQVCRKTEPGHDGTGRQAIKTKKREWLGDGRVRGERVDDVVGWFVCGLAPMRYSSAPV